MEYLENLVKLCEDFKQKGLETKELQERLETALLPDNLSAGYRKALHNFHNDLEEILYFYPPEEQAARTMEVVEKMLAATRLEQAGIST